MEQDQRRQNPEDEKLDRVIIRSPVSLTIFAVAILGLAAAALSLISQASPLTS